MLLRPVYPNGPFGDPALYVWEINAKDALLIDCGDLSRLSIRQLLRVSHIFLSHCHIDHFFGFDLFLRVHVGIDKTTTIFGPPETSERVAGKLQGYTWNLLHGQNMEFVAVDLDCKRGRRATTRFHARNRFRPSKRKTEAWDPSTPVLDAGIYRVNAAELDHRTPSMAYAIEEKLTVGVNAQRLREMGLKPGRWINELKNRFLFGRLKGSLGAELRAGGKKNFTLPVLAREVLLPRQRHKIVYATDGAASAANRKKLRALAEGADMMFCETCFLQEDAPLARETKHFTAAFVGKLAREAGVKKLAPFHFSKRYMERPRDVYDEIRKKFPGEVIEV